MAVSRSFAFSLTTIHSIWFYTHTHTSLYEHIYIYIYLRYVYVFLISSFACVFACEERVNCVTQVENIDVLLLLLCSVIIERYCYSLLFVIPHWIHRHLRARFTSHF